MEATHKLLLLFSSVLLSAGVELASAHSSDRHLFNFRPTTLFVFGDSYADTGNVPKVLPTASSWKFPYGVSFPGKPAGRFSDGRIWTDYVARFIGLKSPIPYKWRNYAVNRLKYGMNFAVGGTGVFDTFAAPLPNMTSQIDFFQQVITQKLYSTSDLQSSVALVSVAGNDYSTYTSRNGTVQGFPALITKLVNQLAADLKRIHQLGVKKVAVGALQPVGCLPGNTVTSSFKKCNDTLDQLVLFHNQLLQQAVALLNNETKDSTFVILDLYSAFNTVLQNKGQQHPGSTRFENPLKPCCVGFTRSDFCGSVDVNGKKQYSLCEDPESAFFKAMDAIAHLCKEAGTDSLEETEVQRFSSSITFLKECKHYTYEPRTVRFSRGTEAPLQNAVTEDLILPQFSSAAVPKEKEDLSEDPRLEKSSTDFVMHVGGLVWALDWCPRLHEDPGCPFKREFVAVGAHPPGSYYHNIGAPLTGRGVVQIWCVLNVNGDEEAAKSRCFKSVRKPLGRPKKQTVDSNNNEVKNKISRPIGRPRKNQKEDSSNNEVTKISRPRRRPTEKQSTDTQNNEATKKIPKPRRRPEKKPVEEPFDNLHCNEQHVQALAVQYPKDFSELLAIEGVSVNSQVVEIPEKKATKTDPSVILPLKIPVRRRSKNMAKARINSDNDLSLPSWNQNEHEVHSSIGNPVPENLVQGPLSLLNQSEHELSSSMSHREHDENSGQGPLPRVSDKVPSDNNFASTSITKDVTLPRIMLCLAHNGKVAWDVKWRPCDVSISKCKHRMGYLAVLLGNGSLEVWDVPLPHIMKSIYCSSGVEGTDPRFVKLEPVFKCSIIQFGGQQSIPLTVEWSTSRPYDCLLAGCHDGTVALWKFSANGTCGDTRPFLRFIADTFPIRAVSWAPVDSDHESGNVILTAGHLGVKFWDTRDPFRPLWNLQPNPRYICSVDWVANPRCILMSFDDGTMRLLSLSKAAYDAPVHGKSSGGPKGIHMIHGSSYATWSVQVSRLTGMVAYCSAEGTVCHFRLTEKMVGKDPGRNRTPHVMCCFLSEDETTVVVNTPLPNVPLTSQKSEQSAEPISRSTQRTVDAGMKDPTSKDQVLALCYGNDPAGPESEYEETLAAFITKSKLKPKGSTKKRKGGSQALVPSDEEQEDMSKRTASGKRAASGKKKPGENEECERALSTNVSVKEVDGNEMERIVSKTIAMHKVRWNMNKGSERWLCYGGTAGIVRCQEINSML